MEDWNALFDSHTSSGVYEADPDQDEAELRNLVTARGLDFVPIDLSSVVDKEGFLREVARALEFPDYFGMNWDALNDCLTDMSWKPAAGYVLLVVGFKSFREKAAVDATVAVQMLRDAADFWREQGMPFYIILSD